jgi:hypothetical protein
MSGSSSSKRSFKSQSPKVYSAKRIDTEPRSGGILLATGVSRWNLEA